MKWKYSASRVYSAARGVGGLQRYHCSIVGVEMTAVGEVGLTAFDKYGRGARFEREDGDEGAWVAYRRHACDCAIPSRFSHSLQRGRHRHEGEKQRVCVGNTEHSMRLREGRPPCWRLVEAVLEKA